MSFELAETKDGIFIKKNDTVLNFSSKYYSSSGLFSTDQKFPSNGNIEKFACLIGCIELKINKYIIIATKTENTGTIRSFDSVSHEINKITDFRIIPINKQILPTREESQYLKLLNDHLSKATLYFSPTYDLTNSSQRQYDMLATSNSNEPSFDKCDKRFFWNYYVTKNLRELSVSQPSYASFVTPIIYGYSKFVDSTYNNHSIKLGLITRRSVYRAGTRYFRRGVDDFGNVGNFNETEQILVVDNNQYYSFLQTRGSVPVQWCEVNNLKYKPQLFVNDSVSMEHTKKHFDQQVELYGDNYLVNLVNQKGYEMPVKKGYEDAVKFLHNPKLHYIYFDFHHECRKMQWHRVHLLIDELVKLGLHNNNYFHYQMSSSSEGKLISKQTAIVRTNCMDCLDRTNVVQSVLASWVLQNQLEFSDVVSHEKILESNTNEKPAYKSWNEENPDLLFEFQNFWADNADSVSCAYSGTGALKTDFTRTGKRTYAGALQDLKNSISRYYQNNLTDGPRQDGYDLFLGNFKPFTDAVQNPFSDRRPSYIQVVPSVIYFSVLVFVATVLFPRNSSFKSLQNLTFFFGSVASIAFSLKYIMKNGMQYVNWPKLCDVGFLEVEEHATTDNQFQGMKFNVNPQFLTGFNKKQ